MRLPCNGIVLSPSLASLTVEVVVVSALEGARLCGDDAYQRLSAWVVVRQLERQWGSLDRETGRFATRSDVIGLHDTWLDDHERAMRVRSATASGHLVGVRPLINSAGFSEPAARPARSPPREARPEAGEDVGDLLN